MEKNNVSPWFKLFALMIVGGVAKELFGQPAPARITYNQALETVDKVKELKSDDNKKSES